MLRVIVLLLALSIFLAACAPFLPPEPIPPAVVLITSTYPSTTSRCTGAALSEHLVLTADHCKGFRRIVTQGGQTTSVARVYWSSEKYELALLETADALRLPRFVAIATLDERSPAVFYGLCPWYMVTTPRALAFEQMTRIEVGGVEHLYQQWVVTQQPGEEFFSSTFVCGGDSGGLVLQHGALVGVGSAIRAHVFLPIGRVLFAAPAHFALKAFDEEH